MKFNVILTQLNKKGLTSFTANKTVNTGESKGLEVVALEVAHFCKAIQKLCESNKQLGYRSAMSGIKKSLPMGIKIQGLNEDDDISIQLDYRTFGKFVNEATEANIRKFLEVNIAFAEAHGNWVEA